MVPEIEWVRNNSLNYYERLASALTYSPFDFIRRVAKTGDKELFLEHVIKALPEQDDLRFVMKLRNGIEVLVLAEKLGWDSRFFGYNIAKLLGIFPLAAADAHESLDYGEVVQALHQIARRKGIRYLSAFVDPRDLATLSALGHAGYALIETRLYYHLDLRKFATKERHKTRLAVPADVPSLGRTAQEMVNPYDRFHADPFISRADADRVMYEWVDASIANGFADATIVPDVADPTAFCTVRYHRNNWDKWRLKLAQPVFSAVSREMSGWYGKILSEVNYHLIDIGAEHAFLATQVTNSAVVRVWESLGYQYGKSEHVLRRVLDV